MSNPHIHTESLLLRRLAGALVLAVAPVSFAAAQIPIRDSSMLVAQIDAAAEAIDLGIKPGAIVEIFYPKPGWAYCNDENYIRVTPQTSSAGKTWTIKHEVAKNAKCKGSNSETSNTNTPAARRLAQITKLEDGRFQCINRGWMFQSAHKVVMEELCALDDSRPAGLPTFDAAFLKETIEASMAESEKHF